MIKQCVIIAGGLGTRLSGINESLPKALTKINDEPIIENQIKKLKNQGIKDIVLLLGHHANQIIDHIGDGSNYGVSVNYVIEKKRLGTGGALYNAINILQDEFLIIYGDIFFDISIENFYEFHKNKETSTSISLLVHPNDHPFDSDLVKINDKSQVTEILPYPHEESLDYKNLVNAAAYIFKKESILNFKSDSEKFDIAKDLLPNLIKDGIRVYAYNTIEYLKDMGTPERLKKVKDDIASGKVFRRSHLNNEKEAIFLDRDGVVNYDTGHINNVDDFILIDGAAEGIKIFNKLGILVIIVTNQPVIARGELTFDGLAKIHMRMERLLGNEGAFIDDLFFCPHHPDSGFPGEIVSLKKPCNCRKPKTGMIDEALDKYNISNEKSWMIGDRESDIKAGKDSGLKTVLIRSDHKIDDLAFEADYSFENLIASAKFIESLEI